MSSKALYKSSSSIAPKLVHRMVNIKGSRCIEIWTTTCIVTNFGKTTSDAAKCSILVNPANPELSGCSNFTYFPRGGPVPSHKLAGSGSMHKDWQPLGYVSNWGGMEVGSGMMYPVSVVDGLVHQLGGWKLAAACRFQRLLAKQKDNSAACPIGSAVYTTQACDKLLQEYTSIIHTAPPFYLHDENPMEQLHSCYQSALHLAAQIPSVDDKSNIIDDSNNDTTSKNNVDELRVASPLLGAGARGFPTDVAIDIAAKASWRWLHDQQQREDNNGETSDDRFSESSSSSSTKSRRRRITLAFGLLEETWATALKDALQRRQQENGRRSE